MFNATFNKISAILWRSVFLMEETGVPRENHWPATSHWQTLSHIMLYRVHLAWDTITSSCLGQKNICLFTVTSSKKSRSDFHFILFFSFYFTYGNSGLRTYPYLEKVPDFRIYLIALRSEGVIIPQKNCCSRIIKKLMPIIFQDVTGNSFFRPKISDVSTFTFDLSIKWTRVAAENRVGRVTVNRHIFYFGLNTFL
jgi:hypothetical protein